VKQPRITVKGIIQSMAANNSTAHALYQQKIYYTKTMFSNYPACRINYKEPHHIYMLKDTAKVW